MVNLAAKPLEQNIFLAAIVLFIVAVFGGVLAGEPLFFTAPVAFLLAYQLTLNYKAIFFLLLIVTPPAIEYYFPNGFATTLPTEPLMIILTLTCVFMLILKKDFFNREFLTHPITIILYIHYIWIIVTTIFSEDIVVSLKFLAAKTWYVVTFYFLASQIIKNTKDFRKVFWCLFVPTLGLVVFTLVNHMNYQFRFSEVNKTMVPFFRNHVNYAVFLALLLPFIFIASKWYERYSWQRMLLNFSKVLFLTAIYFSYTRSSWLSVIVALMAWGLMQRRLLLYGVGVAVVGVIVFCFYMLHDNRYLDYAPEYTKTIYHGEFSEHMAATATLEDVSSAERIYRWVAAIHMIEDKPVMGFGPSQFFDNYKNYTVNKFETYISRNTERSTVHNYYLQTTVEQGFIGLFIWVVFIIAVLIYAQRLYFSASSRENKNLIMAVTLSFITILVNIALSDLIEADKIGTTFFMLIAILVNMDIYMKKRIKDPV